MLGLAAVVTGREHVGAPAIAWREWRAILAEAGRWRSSRP